MLILAKSLDIDVLSLFESGLPKGNPYKIYYFFFFFFFFNRMEFQASHDEWFFNCLVMDIGQYHSQNAHRAAKTQRHSSKWFMSGTNSSKQKVPL